MTSRQRQTTKGTTAKNRTGSARTAPLRLLSVREEGQTPTVPIRRWPCWSSGPAMSSSGNTGPRQFGPSVSPSWNTGPRQFGLAVSPSSGARFESEPTIPRLVPPSPFREKSQEAALAAAEGAGGSKPLLLDDRCDSSVKLREQRPVDLTGGRGVTTDPSGSVDSSSCSTGTDAARCTWVSVREDEGGPANPVDVFRGGPRVGGKTNVAPEKALFRYASWRRGKRQLILSTPP